MEKALSFVADYWFIFGPLLLVVLSAINGVREHYTKSKSTFAVWLIDALLEAASFWCSAGASRYPGIWGKFKLPLLSVPPVGESKTTIRLREIVGKSNGLLLVLCLTLCTPILTACTTTAGEKSLDTCKALSLAVGGHQVAQGAATIVCQSLPKAQQAKCFEQSSKYASIGGALIESAAAIAKACGL